MANKTEKSMAYDAGRAALSEPPDRRTPDACPFPADTEERSEWLRGLSDALDEAPDPTDLRRAIKEAQSP
jgi:ribosome modulation factor